MEVIISTKNHKKFIVRPIKSDDQSELQKALLKLSSQSKSQRFFAMKNSFSEEELKFLTNADDYNHLAYVAIHLDENTHTLEGAGVIRAVRDLNHPNRAEIAMTIIDKFQGMGLGAQLLLLLSSRASDKGITEFTGSLQRTNTAMLKLLSKFTQLNTQCSGTIISFTTTIPFKP